MKTLDEVIQALDNWMPDCDSCVFYCDVYGENNCTIADALHYLKEHKNQQDFYDQSIHKTIDMINKCEKTVAEYLAVNNPPLTWDELKQMEGKPVWVEDSNGKGEWVLLSGTEEDEYLYFVYRDCVEYKIYREGQGERWQAYRKERE